MALYIWVHWDNWEFDKVLYWGLFCCWVREREREEVGWRGEKRRTWAFAQVEGCKDMNAGIKRE